MIGSTALLALAFISFVVYLALSKAKFHEDELRHHMVTRKTWLQKLKNIFFNLTFIFLSIIPLICAALDVTYMVVGIIGEAGILSAMVILNNGRKRWEM